MGLASDLAGGRAQLQRLTDSGELLDRLEAAAPELKNAQRMIDHTGALTAGVENASRLVAAVAEQAQSVKSAADLLPALQSAVSPIAPIQLPPSPFFGDPTYITNMSDEVTLSSGGGQTAPIDVTQAPYNADPTGVGDSSAAIQAAINFVKPGGPGSGYQGAVLMFPPGRYNVGTQLNLTGFNNGGITFLGMGSAGAQFSNPNINWIGSNTVPMALCTSISGLELRSIFFSFNGAYTADMLYIHGGAGGDCTVINVIECAFRTIGSGTSCNSYLAFSQCDFGRIEKNLFGAGAANMIWLGPNGDGAASQFVNVFTIEKNVFLNASTNGQSHIRCESADVEAMTIKGNAFEFISGAPSLGAISASSYLDNRFFGLNIEGNWMGDGPGSNAPWIGPLTVDRNSRIAGNTIFSNTDTTHPAIVLEGQVLIEGNYCEGGVSPAHTNLNVYDLNNDWQVGAGNIFIQGSALNAPFVMFYGSLGQTNIGVNPNFSVGQTQIGAFGALAARQTMGAKTAAATYGANEQTMLQTAYNVLRTFGFGT
jgi:hypothetical protein